MFSNMGAGESVDGRTGLVLIAEPSGRIVGRREFVPEEQATVTSSAAGFVWLAHDRIWRWGDAVQDWPVLPFEYGATDAVITMGDSTLISVNGYQSDEAYRWAFCIVEATNAHAWEVPRVVLGGVAWVGGRVYGLASELIAGHSSRLTELGPDPSFAMLGPELRNDDVWGLVGSDDEVVVLTTGAGDRAELLLLSPSKQTADVIPLTGPVSEMASDWRNGTAGPVHLTMIAGTLYWISNGRLWAANPRNGQTREVLRLSADRRWQLDSQRLYGIEFQDAQEGRRTWSVAVFDPSDGALLDTLRDIAPTGPRDLWLQNVAHLT